MIPTIETILEDLLAGKIEKWQAVEALERHADLAGWSLRDEFAGQALAGVTANPNTPDQLIGFGFEGSKDLLAEYAYACADAMLKHRATRQEDQS